MPLISDQLDGISDARDACESACDAVPDIAGAREQCEDALDCSGYDANLAALAFIELGLLCIMIGAIAAIVINFLNCNDCCGNLGLCTFLYIILNMVILRPFAMIQLYR